MRHAHQSANLPNQLLLRGLLLGAFPFFSLANCRRRFPLLSFGLGPCGGRRFGRSCSRLLLALLKFTSRLERRVLGGLPRRLPLVRFDDFPAAFDGVLGTLFNICGGLRGQRIPAGL
jgi:hypothetical protein